VWRRGILKKEIEVVVVISGFKKKIEVFVVIFGFKKAIEVVVVVVVVVGLC